MQDMSSVEKRYWRISLQTPVKKILEIAVLKLVKGLHKKQYSHQAVDTTWEIYILRQCWMAVIPSAVSTILQVSQFTSSQVKRGKFTVFLQNKCRPQTVSSTAWAVSCLKENEILSGNHEHQVYSVSSLRTLFMCLRVDLQRPLVFQRPNLGGYMETMDDREKKNKTSKDLAAIFNVLNCCETTWIPNHSFPFPTLVPPQVTEPNNDSKR